MKILKKVIVFLFVIVIIVSLLSESQNQVLIPNNSIRFRIIANSNNIYDQEVKLSIKRELEPVIKDILDKSTSLNQTKSLIEKNMNNFENIIKKYGVDYKINYGNNYFPEKEYKGVTYSAGNYESLVITLGSGLGENWWCVLFPPLCLLEAEESQTSDITYSTYIQEIINKYST